jgi:hypothetical protein
MSFISILLIIKIIFTIFFQSDIQSLAYFKLNKQNNQKDSTNYSILMYKCDLCYKYFITKEDLTIHLKEYHPYKFEDIQILSNDLKEKYFDRMLFKFDQ